MEVAFTEFSEQLADWRLQESSRRFEGGRAWHNRVYCAEPFLIC